MWRSYFPLFQIIEGDMVSQSFETRAAKDKDKKN